MLTVNDALRGLAKPTLTDQTDTRRCWILFVGKKHASPATQGPHLYHKCSLEVYF